MLIRISNTTRICSQYIRSISISVVKRSSGALDRDSQSNADWLREEERMDKLVPDFNAISENRPSGYYPSALKEWKRVFDREAGEDEKDVFRGTGRVKDTHLFKGELHNGEYIPLKTASAEKLISLIESNAFNSDPMFWEQILSRMEYLSSTLSVKKIRLILSSLSKVSTLPVSPEELVRLVHILGHELLCRYHSLTLLSCASIAESLSRLKCKDPGTLNVLVICFKQILQEGSHKLSDPALVAYADTLQSAFADLKYHVEVLDEVMTTVSKLRNS